MSAKRADPVRYGLVPAMLVGIAALSVIYPTLAPIDAVALAAILCLFLSRGTHPGMADASAVTRDDFQSRVAAHSGEVICVIDRGTVVRYVSPSGPAKLGWNEDAIIGCTALDLVHPVDRAVAAEGLATALSGPGLYAPIAVAKPTTSLSTLFISPSRYVARGSAAKAGAPNKTRERIVRVTLPG